MNQILKREIVFATFEAIEAMNLRKTRVASSALVAAALSGIIGVSAGHLNPPPAAVTTTTKTLTEVEPRIAINAINTPGHTLSTFKITRPGSNYLTGSTALRNSGTGIITSSVSTVMGNTAYSYQWGMFAGFGSPATANTASFKKTNGIGLSGNGLGIHATGRDSRPLDHLSYY